MTELASVGSAKRHPFSSSELRELAAKVPTPFHIYDEYTIRRNCRDLKEAFSWAPNFINYFAVKALPNPHILEIIRSEGFGADCSSMAELLLAKAVGFEPGTIMFTSNNTQLEDFRQAVRTQAVLNLDDISHLDFIASAPGVGLPSLISFRYNPGPLRHGNEIIGDPKEAKFGVPTHQIFDCYIKARKMGVSRFAAHTMVVSNSLDLKEFVLTAKTMFQLILDLHEKHAIRVEQINFGGGIGIPYRPEDQAVNLPELGSRVHQLYDEMIKPTVLHPVRLSFECGRAITGSAGVLVTRVIHHKNSYKRFIGVDACMANLMRPAMYGAYHHIDIIPDDNPVALEALPRARDLFSTSPGLDRAASSDQSFDVVGGLCENNDKFAINRRLPSTARIGDLLVIHDTGAHASSMGFNYNGRLRAAEYLKRCTRSGGCAMGARCCLFTVLTSCGGRPRSRGSPPKLPDAASPVPALGSNSIVKIRRAETLSDLFSTIVWNSGLPGKGIANCRFVSHSAMFVFGLLCASIFINCKRCRALCSFLSR